MHRDFCTGQRVFLTGDSGFKAGWLTLWLQSLGAEVSEPLSDYLLLAQRLYTAGDTYAEAWNFGPHDTDARPVRWIVERLTARWASWATWTSDQHPQPPEAQMLKLDCSKARDRRGRQPRWSLSMTIDRVVDWYRAAQSHQDMREFTLGQIEAYQTGASAYA